MFGDNNSPCSKDRLLGENFKRASVGEFVAVRGIKEDNIQTGLLLAETMQQRKRAGGFDAGLGFDLQLFQIGLEGGQGRFGILREVNLPRAAAECFNANGAGSGEEVAKDGAFNARSEHVEKRLPQPVAGRPGFYSLGTDQQMGAKFSCYHAHGIGNARLSG